MIEVRNPTMKGPKQKQSKTTIKPHLINLKRSFCVCVCARVCVCLAFPYNYTYFFRLCVFVCVCAVLRHTLSFGERFPPLSPCRRCLCELAKQIGFSPQARDIFQLEGQISSYRHLVRVKCFAKQRPNKKRTICSLPPFFHFPFPATGRGAARHTVRPVAAARDQGEGAVPALAVGGDARNQQRLAAAADPGHGGHRAGLLRRLLGRARSAAADREGAQAGAGLLPAVRPHRLLYRVRVPAPAPRHQRGAVRGAEGGRQRRLSGVRG